MQLVIAIHDKNFLDRFIDNFTAVDAYTLGSIAWSEWMDRKEKEREREWREWNEECIAHNEEFLRKLRDDDI